MKYLLAILTLTCLSWQSPMAQAAGDASAHYQPCIACHGATAQGNAAMGAPALAGQGAAYLKRQLKHFKTGVRGADSRDALGAQMKPMAGALDDATLSVVASYLSTLPPPTPKAAQAGDLKNGNNYYQSRCGACHGGRAEGNPGLNAPGLAALDTAYLKLQYQNFQLGIRGTHPEDTYGRQMKMMATSLPTEKDLDDVIAYIHSLAEAR